MANDAELLHRYVSGADEGAFAEFVARHINLVYSAALRQLGNDGHLAHDVTQLVFLTAARKAGSLLTHPLLAGWLYTTTHYIAARILRQERSRQLREQKAFQMNEGLGSAENVAWEQIRPALDRVLQSLGERDREVVVLRFFTGCSFAEIGAELGLTEDAARRRVERALDKLRRRFSRGGITSTNAVLATALTRFAVAAAPAGMASTVAHTAVATAASGTGFGLAFFHVMSSSKTLWAGAVVVCAIVAGGFYVTRHARAATGAPTSSVSKPKPPVAKPAAVFDVSQPSGAVRSVASASDKASGRGTVSFTPSPGDARLEGAVPPANGPIPMSLVGMVGANNLFHDDAWGLSMTYPDGWTLLRGMRWGEDHRENTLFMSPDVPSTARPSMYYQEFRDPAATRENAKTYLRGLAQWKENSRIAAGVSDYKNVPGSFAFTAIDGHPAMSYFATFSEGNDVRTEYFIRILGRQGYVMFFTSGRLEDVKPIMPAIEKMAASVKLP